METKNVVWPDEEVLMRHLFELRLPSGEFVRELSPKRPRKGASAGHRRYWAACAAIRRAEEEQKAEHTFWAAGGIYYPSVSFEKARNRAKVQVCVELWKELL